VAGLSRPWRRPVAQLLRDGRFRPIFQTDGAGNVVLCSTSLQPLWNSGTATFPGAFLALQIDGNLVIYRNVVALWNTGTSGN
jgi:hypothetical protein